MLEFETWTIAWCSVCLIPSRSGPPSSLKVKAWLFIMLVHNCLGSWKNTAGSDDICAGRQICTCWDGPGPHTTDTMPIIYLHLKIISVHSLKNFYYSWFTMFCQFLLCCKVIQLCIYIYIYTHTHTHPCAFLKRMVLQSLSNGLLLPPNSFIKYTPMLVIFSVRCFSPSVWSTAGRTVCNTI